MTLTSPSIAGIVLAAGYARRYGADKRTVPVGEHGTLLTRSIGLIKPCCRRVFVVIKSEDAEHAADLLGQWYGDETVIPVIAHNALHGMGASLSSGVDELLAREQTSDEQYTGALVMLADMPFIACDTIARLVQAQDPAHIIFPCYRTPYEEKKWGHPVLFGRRWFSNLSQLTGDRGGRAILRAHPTARIPVVVEDGGILKDIDTPADLQAAL